MDKSMLPAMEVIFTGTDPDSAKGGIGVVLPGYFQALRSIDCVFKSIPTYHPSQKYGKWLPWVKAWFPLLKEIRRIKNINHVPIIYSHVGDGISFIREALILFVCRWMGARTVLHVHSPKVDGYLDKVVVRSLLKLAIKPAETICVLTPWWMRRLESAGINVRIRVIPNPLPADMRAVAGSEKITRGQGGGRDCVTVLSMARLVKGKGVEVMIRAMTMLPEKFQLVVAGDGDQRPILESLVTQLGLKERVEFAGWVSGDDKARLLTEADIFCLPSTYDAFPMSMVEAMAYGLPIVAVKWGGIPDMVADGRVGFLAEEANPDLIAQCLGKMQDYAVRDRMGNEAKTWVLEISASEQVGKKLKQVFEELLNE